MRVCTKVFTKMTLKTLENIFPSPAPQFDKPLKSLWQMASQAYGLIAFKT